MARPGYLSIYADERTQGIFNEFVKRKGITKSTALTEMLEIYMLCQDEKLYLELMKESLGITQTKEMLLQSEDNTPVNDYIFMKLGMSFDLNGNEMDGEETIAAYIRNMATNGLGYTWFSTQSLHTGMSKKKVNYYNKLINEGKTVKILFAIGGQINDICYSATVEGLISNKEETLCNDCPESIPDEFSADEKARIWIKLKNIQKEEKLKAAMMTIRSTGSNLKDVITNSQFHFGYVYLESDN